MNSRSARQGEEYAQEVMEGLAQMLHIFTDARDRDLCEWTEDAVRMVRRIRDECHRKGGR